jgi:hypothetical protein
MTDHTGRGAFASECYAAGAGTTASYTRTGFVQRNEAITLISGIVDNVYWRLLSTDPAAAKKIAIAPKPVISDDNDRTPDETHELGRKHRLVNP